MPARLQAHAGSGKLFHTDRERAEINWLKSLRIEPAYPWFDRPVIDRAVRAGIEQAISTRRKAWIKVKHLEFGKWHFLEGREVLATLSHFVLTLPDRPAVVAWLGYETHDVFGEHDVQDPWTVWPLEFIESVRLSDEIADVDERWEPPAAQLPHLVPPASDWDRYVLRINPLVTQQMTGSVFEQYLHRPDLGGGLIGTCPDGWGVYRIAVPQMPLAEWDRYVQSFHVFLSRHAEDIEILEPFDARQRARAHAQRIVRMYDENAQDVSAGVAQRLWRAHDELNPENPVRVRYDRETGDFDLRPKARPRKRA